MNRSDLIINQHQNSFPAIYCMTTFGNIHDKNTDTPILINYAVLVLN